MSQVRVLAGEPIHSLVKLTRERRAASGAIFGFFSIWGRMWLNQMELSSECKYLRAALKLYQQHQMLSAGGSPAAESTDASTE